MSAASEGAKTRRAAPLPREWAEPLSQKPRFGGNGPLPGESWRSVKKGRPEGRPLVRVPSMFDSLRVRVPLTT